MRKIYLSPLTIMQKSNDKLVCSLDFFTQLCSQFVSIIPAARNLLIASNTSWNFWARYLLDQNVKITNIMSLSGTQTGWHYYYLLFYHLYYVSIITRNRSVPFAIQIPNHVYCRYQYAQTGFPIATKLSLMYPNYVREHAVHVMFCSHQSQLSRNEHTSMLLHVSL